MVFPSLHRRVCGTPQNTRTPIVKPHDPVVIQCITPLGEVDMLAEERLAAAARHQAFYLAFGALRERAKPAEIAAAPSLPDEDLDLMVSHADLRLLLETLHCQAARPVQHPQAAQVIEPHREIDILAFMPDRDSQLPEGRESWDLAPQRPRYGADQRHLLHFRQADECLRHRIGG